MPSPGGQFLSDEFGDIEDYFVSDYWLIDQYVGDTLWTWGRNAFGSLGNNDNTGANSNTPVTTFAGATNWKQVEGGGGTGLAIKTDGTLWGWGRNGYAETGNNNAGVQVSTPVTTFSGGTNWKYVVGGMVGSMGLKTDGTIWTWGDNGYGQLGNNQTSIPSPTPVPILNGGNIWKTIACGLGHALAIKTDGTLWGWGKNDTGQLGLNDTVDRPTRVQISSATNWKSIAAGDAHTIALKTDGTLWVWGRNDEGQLGINQSGAGTSRTTPVTTFSGGTNWKFVEGGYQNSYAIKTDGTLWTWGANSFGQLGINATAAKSTPVTTFAGGTDWKYVTGGTNNANTAAIKTDGTLWTWGRSSNGEGGTNTTTSKLTPVTTFAGGTNWKQVSCGEGNVVAVKCGLNADLS